MKKKQSLITDYFYPKVNKKIKGYNQQTNTWHCVCCGYNLGTHNPRQYCNKYYCPYEDI
jgi:hypothetical protein